MYSTDFILDTNPQRHKILLMTQVMVTLTGLGSYFMTFIFILVAFYDSYGCHPLVELQLNQALGDRLAEWHGCRRFQVLSLAVTP